MNLAGFGGELPAHLTAVQQLVNRCPTPELRKGFIVMAAAHGAIEGNEAELLIQANQLESA